MQQVGLWKSKNVALLAVGQERSSATTEATERNMGLSVVVFIQLVITLLPYRFHRAANQLFCLHQQTRGALVEVQVARNLEFQSSVLLHQRISPLATWTRTENPSPAKTSLLGAIGDYGLLFTSGVHRLLVPCEGRQSWRRPNDTHSAISNCNTHDR
jgi:hypothetical protein